ncbi:MAG: alpha/beta fold hydrolase [Bacteroidetes bacterium]|nr:alpha/beta fold hydrolase [Bacteroidota bacterium]
MLHFSDRGNGHTLVMLHGFCEDHRIWESFIAQFPDSLRIICMDLPGFGKSQNGQEDLNSWAQYCLDTLKSAGFDKFSLCGHSLGGYVALAMLNKAPERILHYISFHSTAEPDSMERAQNRLRQVRFLQNYGVDPYVRQLVPGLFRPGTDEVIIQYALNIASEQNAECLASALRSMLQRPDRNKLLKSISCPVMYISGVHDAILSMDTQTTQINSCIKGKHLVLKNSGHMGMLEEPEICRATLLEWLSLTPS